MEELSVFVKQVSDFSLLSSVSLRPAYVLGSPGQGIEQSAPLSGPAHRGSDTVGFGRSFLTDSPVWLAEASPSHPHGQFLPEPSVQREVTQHLQYSKLHTGDAAQQG